jgi:hypothetical protein
MEGTSGGSKPSKIKLIEEQKAHMEANRFKALERVAATRLVHSSLSLLLKLVLLNVSSRFRC